MRALMVAAAIAAMSSTAIDTARACSCVRPSAPAAYIDKADQVFFAKAQAPRHAKRSDKVVQSLDVLHALKGRPGKVFRLVRDAGQRSTCDRRFRKGEVALVFVVHGRVGLCAGNLPLARHRRHLAEFLARSGPGSYKPSKPTLEAFRRTFELLLAPYLHARPDVPVIYPPGDGRSIKIGKTKLSFVRRADPRRAVEITDAVRHGPIHLISGRYRREGYAFTALLYRKGRRFEVLYRWAAER